MSARRICPFLAVIALIALPSTAAAFPLAQDGAAILRGSVSSNDGRPVVGAAIRGVDNEWSGVTDGSGGFEIGHLRPGTYLFEVSHPDFAPLTVRVALDGGRSVTIPSGLLKLERKPTRLDPGTPARGGIFIRRSQIEALQARVMTDLLRQVPGLRIQHGRRGAEDQLLSPWPTVRVTRARFDCPPMLFVNGIHLGSSDLVDLDGIVQPQDLEGLEVYRGISEVPARFSLPGAQCGVLLFWTR